GRRRHAAHGAARRAAEREGPHALRVPQRQLLRHHAAHRRAVDERGVVAERVEQRRSVIGEHRDRVLGRGLVATAAAPAVVDDEAMMPAVRLHQVRDLEHVRAEPADPEQRLALAVLLVVQPDAVDGGVRHEDSVAKSGPFATPRRRYASRAPPGAYSTGSTSTVRQVTVELQLSPGARSSTRVTETDAPCQTRSSPPSDDDTVSTGKCQTSHGSSSRASIPHGALPRTVNCRRPSSAPGGPARSAPPCAVSTRAIRSSPSGAWGTEKFHSATNRARRGSRAPFVHV